MNRGSGDQARRRRRRWRRHRRRRCRRLRRRRRRRHRRLRRRRRRNVCENVRKQHTTTHTYYTTQHFRIQS